ncbi:hypothetical protein FRC20_008062 [Serendipita sp. 405]|nr:hypothetical protein FRC20_008062 [Serendipita sp. 405]
MSAQPKALAFLPPLSLTYYSLFHLNENVHYRQIVPAVPPVQQAAQGTPSWPVQLRIDTQVQPQSASMHTLHRHSASPTSLFSRPSEVGPSRTVRTGRTARRRSIQEASPAMSPLDADGGDVLESASSKRSKGGTPRHLHERETVCDTEEVFIHVKRLTTVKDVESNSHEVTFEGSTGNRILHAKMLTGKRFAEQWVAQA